MNIIPVLDLLDGVVVRGVAGRRSEYRPISSCLTPSTDPLDVASAIRDALALDFFYVAELDAILGVDFELNTLRELNAVGAGIMVDAGVRSMQTAASLFDAGIHTVIAGLETIPGPNLLGQLCREFGSERICFSLDVKGGAPLGRLDAWASSDPLDLATEAIDCGVTRIIVLDLARVGVAGGTGTDQLCGQLRSRFPNVQLTTGGGVRGAQDILDQRAIGVENVLVASAIHNGSIDREDVLQISRVNLKDGA